MTSNTPAKASGLPITFAGAAGAGAGVTEPRCLPVRCADLILRRVSERLIEMKLREMMLRREHKRSVLSQRADLICWATIALSPISTRGALDLSAGSETGRWISRGGSWPIASGTLRALRRIAALPSPAR